MPAVLEPGGLAGSSAAAARDSGGVAVRVLADGGASHFVPAGPVQWWLGLLRPRRARRQRGLETWRAWQEDASELPPTPGR
jgi:hypothetical protein